VVDLATIVRELEAKGVTLKATEQAIDTGSSSGRAFLGMLAVFAQFETEVRKERQLEGIAKAKAAGKYKGKGRPKTIDASRIRDLHANGKRIVDIMAIVGASRSTVERALA
jgi:DNA invertase Pin-like site-specific DNA recombinase